MSYESTYKNLVDLEGELASLPSTSIKKFPDNFIFDEDKTVKWNREEVKRRNSDIASEKEKIKQRARDIISEARDEIIHYLMDDYGFTEKVASVIFKKAEEDGHSCGFCEVLSYANSYGDFTQDLFDAEKEEKT